MVREAEAHAQEDRAKRELVEARNQADSLVYTAEKTVTEYADKVSAEVKQEVEAKVAAVREAVGGEDVSRINDAVAELNTALAKIGEAMYQQAGSTAEEPPSAEGEEPPPPEDKPDDTVEGEYREV